jgi:hypothetical protein
MSFANGEKRIHGISRVKFDRYGARIVEWIDTLRQRSWREYERN